MKLHSHRMAFLILWLCIALLIGACSSDSKKERTPEEKELFCLQCQAMVCSACQSSSECVSLCGCLSCNQSSTQQTLVMSGPNIYSPDLVMNGGALKMYFGGWLDNGQTHDNIYVASCGDRKQPCSNPRVVLNAAALHYEHLNDPAVIRLSQGNYIMYLTGVFYGQDGLVAANNHIFFSTSLDGIAWSNPQLLVEHHWLPSVTIDKNGNVMLYSNDNNVHGGIDRHDLGISGIAIGQPQRVQMPGSYNNVHVRYKSESDRYEILGEKATAGGSSVIDFLTSSDGLIWNMAQERVIVPAQGQFRVGTPASHPDNSHWVYFGSTAQTNSVGFKIYEQDW